jgi:hypothetical protein
MMSVRNFELNLVKYTRHLLEMAFIKVFYDYLRAVCACAIVKECVSGLLFRVVPLLEKLQS